MSKVGSWSTTAGSNNSTPPDGWPEGQAPSTVNDCAREMMAQIRTLANDAAFIDQGFTPTFISATSFSVAADQTSAIHAGRRLKLFDGASVIYATVATASFTAVTTIHVSADDAEALTSSLSSFAISVISRRNTPIPPTAQNIAANLQVSISEVAVLSYPVAANELMKGTTFIVETFFEETIGIASSETSTARFRIGTTTLTGTIPAALSISLRNALETDHVFGILTVQSVGAAGLVRASLGINRNVAISSSIRPNAVAIGSAVTVDTTVANLIEFTYQNAGTSVIHTQFPVASIRKVGPQ